MKKISLIVCCSILLFKTSSAQNSVLSTGNWYKITTSTEGVYKISYTDLESYGINPSLIDPRNLKLYGNGGGMLPEANNAPKIIDLQELAIKIVGETDGVFDPSDYILFYGQAPDKWTFNASTQNFSHEKNVYSDVVAYFLTVGTTNGKRITLQNSSLASVTDTTDKYSNLIFHELDSINLIQSGRKWLGESINPTLNFAYNIPNLDLSSTTTFKTAVTARSGVSSQFSVNLDGNITSTPINSITLTCYSCRYANEATSSLNILPSSTTIPITLNYSQPDTFSKAWLDYFELITRNHLSKNGNQLLFRDPLNIGNGNITAFKISNTLSTDIVWEITHHNTIVEQVTTFNSGTTSFNLSTDSLREFIVFDDSNLLSPSFISQIANQNFLGMSAPEMIIITHPNFYAAANNLANFHISNDGIVTEVVTIDEVYNEFSSGVQDITAINNFMEHLYHQPSSALKYLLLFGDGSYDYKNRILPNTNFIPTYQTKNSIDIIGSVTSDDYYALLDSTEGTWAGTELLDIAVGRLPVKTLQEANDVVSKINYYKTNSTLFGNWRKTITFIGDDEDNNEHMRQADFLAEIVNNNYCEFETNKIFFDEFQQITNGTQQSYPEVEQKIVDAFRNGSIMFNYTGHGGNTMLAHEHVMDTTILDTLNNSLYPLMILATSESSRYDDPETTSLGEQFLLHPNAGSIATFSTSRLGFSTPNFQMNQSVYNTIFNKVNGNYKTLGDAFKEIKNLNAANLNNRSFTLLGDPAITLNFPEFIVNAVHPDTLVSSSTNYISGQIEDENNIVQTWFNGDVIVTIKGHKDTIITLANDGGAPFTFYDRRTVVYVDTVSVVNGLFNYSFDLNNALVHTNGNAKISYYAFNSITDASGCDDDIYINDVLASINDHSTIDIEANIFPNPSSNTVTISLEKTDIYNFSLMNNVGQVVYQNNSFSSNSLSFSVQGLTNGVYFYKISNSKNQQLLGKLIVQH